MTNSITPWAVSALLVLGAAAGAQPPQPPKATQSPHQHESPRAASPTDMSEKCKAMMAQRQAMMAEMRAADEQLDALVAKMNAATGQEKIDAIAATVKEIVTQRRTMRDRAMSMQDGMMAHMMEHMQAGGDTASACPMVTGGMKH